jgi:hypothetical protein
MIGTLEREAVPFWNEIVPFCSTHIWTRVLDRMRGERKPARESGHGRTISPVRRESMAFDM